MSFVATLDGANIQHESALVNTQNVEKMRGRHGAIGLGVRGSLSRRNEIKGR